MGVHVQKNSHLFLFILVFLMLQNIAAQSYFAFPVAVKKENVPFKLLSNLIVFPMEVNGKKLNFILDSGVGNTILFNFNKQDSIPLHNLEKIKLQGLGTDAAMDAFLSKNNSFKIKQITGVNQSIYVLLDDTFDLSSKLGTTIHGIIGYELLKNFAVTINYHTKRIQFQTSESYVPKACKKCELFELEFNSLKPYINVGVQINTSTKKIIPVKLLIDSGGSDAMWLFENSAPGIVVPTNYFEDYLGEGLSGAIHGKRTVIEQLVLGKFKLKHPTVSFPDEGSIANARKFTDRNGSIGATVLKRFKVTFNYPKSEFILKKGSAFKSPFRYNMSGIELVYSGKQLVKEQDDTSFALSGDGTAGHQKIQIDYNYAYTFKPTYKIYKVTVGSPAYKAGLQKDDVVIKINGKYTYNLKLDDITAYFYMKEGKRISMVVERNGRDYLYQFNLKNSLVKPE